MKTQGQFIFTQGSHFTQIEKVGTRAVRFSVKGQGDYVVGFAKDKNAFMEAFNGQVREVTRWAILKQLDIYKGKDVVELVAVIKSLVPMSWKAAGCEVCGVGVPSSVQAYSTRVFGRVLCRGHQEGQDRTVTEERRPQGGAYETVTCSRCGGNGAINMFNHVKGGVCFKCEGTGQVKRKVTAPTSTPQPTQVMDQGFEAPPEWEAEVQAACNESMTITEDKPKRKSSTPKTPKAKADTKESPNTSTQKVSDKETDSTEKPKPKRQRRATGEAGKEKTPSQRGSRKASTGVKGTSTKTAESMAQDAG